MGAALWVHGHTHDSMVWENGSGTLIVCNPAGYPRLDGGRGSAGFDPRMCVAIQESDGTWEANISARTPAQPHGDMRTRW